MQAVAPPGRRGGLVVAPVGEAGEGGHLAPDGADRRRVADRSVAGGAVAGVAARGDGQPPPRAGPADRAGVLQPLVGTAHRELALGRPVELPHRPGPTRSMAARFRDGGQGAPAWASRRSESNARRAPARPDEQMRWRWVGTRNAVVGRSSPQHIRARWRRRSASRMASDPPESSVPAEKRIETVWYIGEHTMCRSSGSNATPRPRPRRRPARSPRPTPRWSPPWAGPVVPEV